MSHRYFRRVPWWRRGYHCRQVDGFLNRLDASLSGQLPPMAPSDIRRVGFELVRHGYDIAMVDAHLDALEERLFTVQSTISARRGRRGRLDTAQDEQFLQSQLDQAYMHRFPRARAWRRGYDVDDVDDFVDAVLKALSGRAALTVEQARTVAFRPKRGGYDEDAVDETLDRVVEVLLVKGRAAAIDDERATGVETAEPPS
jgi:DivIVA domain-containing protein